MRITIRPTCKRDVVEAFAADPANATLIDVDSLTISDLDATSLSDEQTSRKAQR
jgi:hypothetical protein